MTQLCAALTGERKWNGQSVSNQLSISLHSSVAILAWHPWRVHKGHGGGTSLFGRCVLDDPTHKASWLGRAGASRDQSSTFYLPTQTRPSPRQAGYLVSRTDRGGRAIQVFHHSRGLDQPISWRPIICQTSAVAARLKMSAPHGAGWNSLSVHWTGRGRLVPTYYYRASHAPSMVSIVNGHTRGQDRLTASLNVHPPISHYRTTFIPGKCV
jgi:hypothetical protein